MEARSSRHQRDSSMRKLWQFSTLEESIQALRDAVGLTCVRASGWVLRSNASYVAMFPPWRSLRSSLSKDWSSQILHELFAFFFLLVDCFCSSIGIFGFQM